ncbi:LOW QUALITY PROTEIN: BCL2/adenovirus E1B 19 kDa protein-interacting protein 3-like [Porphyrio hochstetteri]
MGAGGRHVTGSGGAERGCTRWAMACAGDDGSWVELWCGPGCPEPEPVPSRFSSCHADVEQMLLEAQLETESGDGALFTLGSPAWSDDGAGQVSEQPGENELLSPCSRPQPACPHPREQDVPDEAEWRERRLPASLSWACARRPRHLSRKEFAFVCSPQPVLWSLQGGAVERKKRPFSSELLLLFIPSLLLSHMLTLGLGIYIGKRLAASSANPL